MGRIHCTKGRQPHAYSLFMSSLVLRIAASWFRPFSGGRTTDKTMGTCAGFAEFSRMPLQKKLSVSLLSGAVLLETWPHKLSAYQEAQFPTQTAQPPRYTQQSAERQQQTAGKPHATWQVATVTAVRPYQVPDADPSVTSYKVSVRVGNTVYVVLNTPRPGTDIGRYARGRQVLVLVGEHTITYNDILGNSFQVPILSRTTVTPRSSR